MGAFRACFCAVLLSAVLCPGSVAHSQSVESFYRGQNLRILVGYGPGTGYDVYARVLGRHIARFIPGQPTIVVQNMPGAGSLTMANNLYNVAPRDGSTIGIPARNLLMEPVYGNDNARFDARKFTWIGSMNRETATCFVWAATGITRIEDVQKREALVGAPSTISASYVYPQLMNGLIGTHFKVVTGYPDSGAEGLAMERGELDGHCAFTWGSLKSARRDWLDNKRINILAQLSVSKSAELPDVPLIMDYAKSATARQTFELVFADQEMARPIGAPPDVPTDRAAALRAAFTATMKDADFVADAEKSGVDIDPIDGAAISALLDRLYQTPPAVVETVKKIRGDQAVSQKE